MKSARVVCLPGFCFCEATGLFQSRMELFGSKDPGKAHSLGIFTSLGSL